MNEARRAEVCSSSEPEQGAHLSLTALSASAELRRLAVSNRCTTVWQNCEQRLQVRCALNPQVSEILRSPRPHKHSGRIRRTPSAPSDHG
jgi:hypothetical protein